MIIIMIIICCQQRMEISALEIKNIYQNYSVIYMFKENIHFQSSPIRFSSLQFKLFKHNTREIYPVVFVLYFMEYSRNENLISLTMHRRLQCDRMTHRIATCQGYQHRNCEYSTQHRWNRLIQCVFYDIDRSFYTLPESHTCPEANPE